MAWIETVPPEEASGGLKRIYDSALKRAGYIAEIIRVGSLNEAALRGYMQMYQAVMFGDSPLSRAQREMIATVVAASADCFYCKTHHAASFAAESGDKRTAELLKEDYRTADLRELDRAMCDYAARHAVTPAVASEEDLHALRALGMTERMILDMMLVIGAFSFFVRMADGLGAALEEARYPLEVQEARRLGKPVQPAGAPPSQHM